MSMANRNWPLTCRVSTTLENWSVSTLEKWTLNDGSVITLEDWALIRRLAAEGVPKARIAARLGISRTTVLKAVGSEVPSRYERRAAPTSFAQRPSGAQMGSQLPCQSAVSRPIGGLIDRLVTHMPRLLLRVGFA